MWHSLIGHKAVCILTGIGIMKSKLENANVQSIRRLVCETCDNFIDKSSTEVRCAVIRGRSISFLNDVCPLRKWSSSLELSQITNIQNERLRQEFRRNICRVCDSFRGDDNGSVFCSATSEGVVSIEFGTCSLRKWPGNGTPSNRTENALIRARRPQGIRRRRTESRSSHQLRILKREVCRNCDNQRGLEGERVCCDAARSKWLRLDGRRCPLRKWPNTLLNAERLQSRGSMGVGRRHPISEQLDETDEARFNADQFGAEVAVLGQGKSMPRLIMTADSTPVAMENLYQGRSAFLICGGPSFARVDHDLLRNPGILTMGINNSVKTFRPHLWVCVDKPANFLRSIWLDPLITKFCPIGNADKFIFDSDQWRFIKTRARDCPAVFFYRRNARFRLKQWLYEDSFNWGNSASAGGGRSVMLVAMRLLFYLGFRNVYLLGADFKMSSDYTYHFEQKRKSGSLRGNNSTYRKLQQWFTELRPIFESEEFFVHNCNPDSALTAFDFIPLEEAVSKIQDEWGMIDLVNERTQGLYDERKPGR